MIASIILAAGLSSAGCGTVVPNPIGGDYTDPDARRHLPVVESYHFTADVENLRHGSSGSIADDIDYTLAHFPNHHRALAAIARLGLREKAPKPAGARYSVDCYFERALSFKPSDAQVRTLFGGYLLATGRADAALLQMQEASRIDPANATAHYNLGLLFVKRKDYAQAREQAHEAYRLGFPLPGLRKQLADAGEWQD